MPGTRIVVIGAGMGGLAAAADLARRGAAVTLCEAQPQAGGKLRQLDGIDAGPTVFTMRWIFEGLFADAGQRLADHLDLVPAATLARHAWRAGGQLDLFADIDRSADAIGRFAGAADARGYRDFVARSAAIHRTLVGPYIASERPSPIDLVRRIGLARLGELWRTVPLQTLWRALGQHFHDPRLRQLFGRYATYVGSSPWFAPATLMLVAHVEQDGVWLVRGGIRRVADAVRALGETQGAHYRFGAPVAEILAEQGRVNGVRLASGEVLGADAVVFNGDVSALGQGLLGAAAQRVARATPRRRRSLSAVTWCLRARSAGFPLAHHNVFFAEDYAAEFEAIFRRRSITAAPTVYLCAQDRGEAATHVEGTPERMLLLINAPADGDIRAFPAGEIAALAERSFGLLAACGLDVERHDSATIATAPDGFNALFPGTGGALYGRANHGPMASFARPGAATALPGLYLAGGSGHPGPGMPMAAMSGRLAAARLLEDLAAHSPRRSITGLGPPALAQ